MSLLKQPVINLQGIGAQTANRLEKLGLRTVQDLLFHLPHRYEDRTRVCPIGALTVGMTALVCGKIDIIDVMPRGRKSLMCKISDGTGGVWLRFFHFSANQYNTFKPDTWLCVFAETRYGMAGLEMVHPDYSIVSGPDAAVTDTRLTPVYPLTEGLSQSVIRKAIKQALQCCEQNPQLLADWIPAQILQDYRYPSLAEAVQTLHAPDDSVTVEALQAGEVPALKRLAFEELLAHHLRLSSLKQQAKVWPAPVFAEDSQIAAHFLRSLPFSLTGAQQRVISEIVADCRLAKPMMRLVQGDVGSGKTIVAAYSALLAVAAGYQVALMAPTELLAEQHFANFSGWFAGFAVQVSFLSGQSKGRARQAVLQGLADGTVNLIIGTHALFQDAVQFHRLGLVIIDEQHRFGVHQRLALREKSQTGS
ncbi:MAG: DEAD/DEAH box helicase, partial [Methylovulum sp.]|nr:DEAD/DEAH box helicase [Methylovulum sp.]